MDAITKGRNEVTFTFAFRGSHVAVVAADVSRSRAYFGFMVRPIMDGWVTMGGCSGTIQAPAWSALEAMRERRALPDLAGLRALVTAHAPPAPDDSNVALATFLAVAYEGGTHHLDRFDFWGHYPARTLGPNRGEPWCAGFPPDLHPSTHPHADTLCAICAGELAGLGEQDRLLERIRDLVRDIHALAARSWPPGNEVSRLGPISISGCAEIGLALSDNGRVRQFYVSPSPGPFRSELVREYPCT
jgi:hypothetical protein